MSTDPTAPSNGSATDPMADASAALLQAANATPSKGKDKASVAPAAEEEEDSSDEEEEEAEEDLAMEEDDLGEIDPSAILAPGARRSTRGARVNYASAEALEKAGLKPEDLEDEQEENYVADEKMEDD
ncbi:unnamed protein product [Peniophora sp. CBMAI 1063]|nr:unnamed protein product [Peniophora sp. CBMAI 1063]